MFRSEAAEKLPAETGGDFSHIRGVVVSSGEKARARWVRPVQRVDKPWGHEEVFALCEGKFCGKTLHVKAGHALSLQYHRQKEETIAVQSGFARLEVGRADEALETFELRAGDCVHLEPGVRHRVTALTDLVVLEASTTELTDVVRLADRYGRQQTELV
jgi:mannose-6-phosphate isomerase